MCLGDKRWLVDGGWNISHKVNAHLSKLIEWPICRVKWDLKMLGVVYSVACRVSPQCRNAGLATMFISSDLTDCCGHHMIYFHHHNLVSSKILNTHGKIILQCSDQTRMQRIDRVAPLDTSCHNCSWISLFQVIENTQNLCIKSALNPAMNCHLENAIKLPWTGRGYHWKSQHSLFHIYR